MKNSIKVQIRFSFKGETYAPEATIDLDGYLSKNQEIPPFDLLVAHANGIDTYSYLFEVMQMGDYVFSDAEGSVAEYIIGNQIDLEGFTRKWQELRVIEQLSAIAQQHLSIDDLDQDPALQQALFAAYRLGKQED
jgi:hypothetical protein